MTSAPDDIEPLLARRRAEAQTARFGRFDPGLLTCLALVPEWTSSLAVDLGVSALQDDDALSALEAAQIIERRPVLGAGGKRQEAFWVRTAARSALAPYLQSTYGSGIEQSLDDLDARLAGKEVVPAAMRSWVQVVQGQRSDPSGLTMVGEVDRLLRDSQFEEAIAEVKAAAAIGALTGGPLADAAVRAQWRIDRAYRRRLDERQLRFFLHRASIEQALDTLLFGDTGQWALHLRGAGGVGKTMCVRYLVAGEYAARRRIPAFSVARVDFDHLDPRFPDTRPGELLLALAGELVGFSAGRGQVRAYRLLIDTAAQLHEALAHTNVDAAFVRQLETRTVGAFAELIGSLPAPVVLVLDTCEELSKLYAPGTNAPAIDNTFDILETLKTRAPSLRVVFAGRRWLTTPPASEASEASGGPALFPRPYVRVLHVGGFNGDEAQRYVELRLKIAGQDDGVPRQFTDKLSAAILDGSREPGTQPAIYSPFQLASYCEWALSVPNLRPEDLLASGDPYVERRIIGRIVDPDTRQGLGVAAAFGTFDIDLISAGLRRERLQPDAVFAGLAGQEWTNVLSTTADGRPQVVQIDEHLLGRLRAVVDADQSRPLVDHAQLGRDAAAVVTASISVGELPLSTIEAAVRMLPCDEAAAFWERLDKLVTAQGAWGWALQVVPAVRAIEFERSPIDGGAPTIMAAVLATEASARVHAHPGERLGGLWREVAATADRHPDPAMVAVLRARATLGLLGAGEAGDVAAEDYESALIAPDGSVLAAVEAIIERGQRPPRDFDARLAAMMASTDPGIATGACVAWVAIALRGSKLDEARQFADRGLETAGGANDRRRNWVDRASTPSPLDRARLARLIVSIEANERVDSVPLDDWRNDLRTRSAQLDATRLAALMIRFELGHRLVDTKVLEGAGTTASTDPGVKATSWLHRYAPSLTIEVAQGWALLGEPQRAADLLSQRREAAVEAADDPDSVEACESALMNLCRRYRTLRYAPFVRRLAREGSPDRRFEAWSVLTLAVGEAPSSPAEAGSWHGWWQCQDARSLAAQRLEEPSTGDFTNSPIALEADRLECALMLPAPPAGSELLRSPAAVSADLSGLPALEPGIEDTVRLMLLTDGLDAVSDWSHGRPPGVAAQVLFAVGELLALRLPQVGADVLQMASICALQAGDAGTAAQARILAGLAAYRAGGQPRSIDEAMALQDRLGLEEWRGWAERADVLKGGPAAFASTVRSASPEIDIRPVTGVPGESTPGTSASAGLVPRGAAPQRSGTSRNQTAILAMGIALFAILFWVPDFSWGVALGLAVLGSIPMGLLFSALAGREWPFSVGLARRVTITRSGQGDVLLTSEPYAGLSEYALGTTPWAVGVLRRLAARRGTWSVVVPLDGTTPIDVTPLRLPVTARQSTLAMLELAIAPDLQHCPWERRLLGAQRPALSTTHLWFRREPGRQAVIPPKLWRSSSVTYLGPRTLAPDGEITGAIPSTSAHASDVAAQTARLVYLIGTPVPTTAGWRFRVTGVTSSQVDTSQRSTVDGEELLDIERLHLGNARLVVFQADPVDGGARPFGDLAEGFSGVSRAALDAGAGTVIIIPPLTDAAVAQCVAACWKRMAARRRPPPTIATLVLFHELKTIVTSDEPRLSVDDVSAPLPVFDVLLFMRSPRGDDADARRPPSPQSTT